MRPAFTLVELLVVVVLVGILASMGTRSYHDLVHRANIARATQEIRGIEAAILLFQARNNRLPATLEEAGVGAKQDPWGNGYIYMPFESAGKGGGGIGAARKDRFLVPLNSDFDLYSKGRDGDSKSPLTAVASHDDIIRANDGGFVGLAEEY